MKKILLFIFMFIWLSFSSSLEASWFSELMAWSEPKTHFCRNWECTLEKWLDIIEWWLEWIEKERSASQYVQDVVIYILSFVSIISVIYIIYAWFNILIWWWDEEKMKKSKQIIIYVIIGLVIMWLAYSIFLFIADGLLAE